MKATGLAHGSDVGLPEAEGNLREDEWPSRG